jgi:hypothetical protein
MELDIKTIYGDYIERFRNTLRQLFPLCRNKSGEYGGGFNEVNQTAYFLRAAENHFGIDKSVSWYELALPYDFDPSLIRDKSDRRIDGVLILKEAKTILLIESKRYESSPIKKLENSMNDALRIQRVLSNDKVLGHWLKMSEKDLESYRKFGLILGAIWLEPGKDNSKDRIFKLWHDKTLFGDIKGNYFGADERILLNNQECDSTWNFHLLGFLWQVKKDNLFPKDIETIIEDRLSKKWMLPAVSAEQIEELKGCSIIVEERANYWYLYPSSFVGKHVNFWHAKNKLWIYKNDPLCKVFSYPQSDLTIRLPDGFTQDEKKKKFISLRILSDSVVEGLRQFFEELDELNP